MNWKIRKYWSELWLCAYLAALTWTVPSYFG